MLPAPCSNAPMLHARAPYCPCCPCSPAHPRVVAHRASRSLRPMPQVRQGCVRPRRAAFLSASLALSCANGLAASLADATPWDLVHSPRCSPPVAPSQSAALVHHRSWRNLASRSRRRCGAPALRPSSPLPRRPCTAMYPPPARVLRGVWVSASLRCCTTAAPRAGDGQSDLHHQPPQRPSAKAARPRNKRCRAL